MKTRERILQTGLRLFNEQGEPNVTTAQIADEMDISAGNLYYHFKGRDEITLELFDRFERESIDLLEAGGGEAPDLEDLWFDIHLTFEIVARYRFLYRNIVDLHARLRKLPRRWRALQQRKFTANLALCKALAENGLLSADEKTMHLLCEQIVLTETFWLSHWDVYHGGDNDEDPVTRGVYQVVCLLTPHMAEEPRDYLLTLGEAYL